MHIRFWPLLFVAVFPFLLAGCDAAGEEGTITLDSETNDEFEPIEYTFSYSKENVRENGRVVVTSPPDSDQQSLDEMLSNVAAASRSDIQSAEVTKITFRRIGGSKSDPAVPKVFSYLSKAEVRLGSDSGPLVALSSNPDVPETPREIPMDLESGASSVGDILKNNNPTDAVLNLDVSNSDDIGPSDEIEVAIFYSVTVR